MASEQKHISHVIFDVDGLLVDTEGLYTDIMQSIADPYGKKFTWDVKVKQMGKKMTEAAKVFISELDLPITVEEYCHQVETKIQQTFPHAKLMPGAERLVLHLSKHKVPMCLATGSGEDEFNLKITNHQRLFSLFSHAVFSGSDPEVKKGKPAPDCFLVAASRFNPHPNKQQVLVFEDAPNGAQGALNAGMPVVWVPDPHVDTADIRDNRQVTLLNSLLDFKPELYGLPPFET